MTKQVSIFITLLLLSFACQQQEQEQKKTTPSTSHKTVAPSSTSKTTAVQKQKRPEDIFLEAFFQRKLHFDTQIKSNHQTSKICTCPSCGFPTLTTRGTHEVCNICNWIDHQVSDKNPDAIIGGPERDLSLTQSRILTSRELIILTENKKKKVIADLAQFLDVYHNHQARMKLLNDKITDTTPIDDPIWDEWQITKDLLKKEIFQ